MADAAYYDELPRTRGAAGALIHDDRGRILLVRPVYQPTWTIPGGVIEDCESPMAACQREVREELGVDCAIEALIGVDWMPPRPGKSAANMFIFAATLTPAQVRRIHLPADELAAHGFTSVAELPKLLAPHTARRVATCALAYAEKRTVYLENGHLPS